MKIVAAFLLLFCSVCHGQTIKFNLKNVTTLVGQDAIIPCNYETTGFPGEPGTPTIKWSAINADGTRSLLYTFKMNDEAATGKDQAVTRDLSITDEGSLVMQNTSLSDNVNFHTMICEVGFGKVAIKEGTLYLDVVVFARPSPVATLVKNVFDGKSEPVEVGICQSGSGYPKPIITFYRGIHEIESSDAEGTESVEKTGEDAVLSDFLDDTIQDVKADKTISVKRSLVIQVGEVDDNAHFYCIVKSGGGGQDTTLIQNASFPLFRVKYQTNKATIKPSMLNPSVGEELTLTCEANGYPAPTIEINDESSASTTIQLTKADNGREIKCSAGNQPDTTVAVMTSYTINVLYADEPKIIGETSVELGKPFQLECTGSSNPLTENIVWKKGDKIISNKTADDSAGQLVIDKVQFEDAGVYTCLVQNGFASLDREAYSDAVIITGLKMTSTEDVLVEGTLEQTVELECTVSSSPAPEFTWVILPSGDKVTPEAMEHVDGTVMYKSVLKVGPLEPSMSKAEYTCTAKNGELEQMKSFELPEIVASSSSTAAIIIVILVLVLIIAIVLAVLYNKGIICKKDEKGDEDAGDIVGTINKDESPSGEDVEAGKPEGEPEEETRLMNGNGD